MSDKLYYQAAASFTTKKAWLYRLAELSIILLIVVVTSSTTPAQSPKYLFLF